MATEVLAIGTGATASADFIVTAAAPVTLCLKDVAGPGVSGAYVKVQIKADNAEYFDIDALSQTRLGLVVVGGGTYRVLRATDSTSCGVFRD